MLTTEQLAERKNGIYGTDASSIWGCNPYRTRYQCWAEKVGLTEPKDLSTNKYVEWGNRLEPEVRKKFGEVTDLSVHEAYETFSHGAHPWMMGHLDGIIWGIEQKSNGASILTRPMAILECKTAQASQKMYWDDETMPKQYLLQVVHYCAIMNVEVAYVAVLFSDYDFEIRVYRRNHELEEMLIAKEKHFWEYNVAQKIAPEPENMDDLRHAFPGSEENEPIIATADIEHTYVQLINTQLTRKSYEREEDKLKLEICKYMGDSTVLLDAFGKPLCTYKKAKPYQIFDSAAFRRSCKTRKQLEKYLSFVKERPGSRRFLTNHNNED